MTTTTTAVKKRSFSSRRLSRLEIVLGVCLSSLLIASTPTTTTNMIMGSSSSSLTAWSMMFAMAQSCNAVPPEQRVTEDAKEEGAEGGRNQRRRRTTRVSVPVVDPNECGLYMAPSTLPKPFFNTKKTNDDEDEDDVLMWGLFAGKDYDKDERIAPLDVAIQITDPKAPPSSSSLADWWILPYVWPAEKTQATFDATNVGTLLPGLGMIPQGIYPLQKKRPKLPRPNVDFEGSRDRTPIVRASAHAGSYTHYQNTTFSTDKQLLAGQELWNKYVPKWFDGQSFLWVGQDDEGDQDMVVVVPSDIDFVDQALQTWEYKVSGDLDSDEAKQVWTAYHAKHASAWSPAVQAIMPTDAEDAMEMLYDGIVETLLSKRKGDDDKENDEEDEASVYVRSVDWLDDHGICLDNIQVQKRPSDAVDVDDDKEGGGLLDGMGLGAFATRFIPKDGVVTTTPVIHMHRQHLQMKTTKKSAGKNHVQLLLNYCYGHASSSLLFFPFAPAINSINHHDLKPNVQLRWSTSVPSATAALEKAQAMSVEELLRVSPLKLGLFMDLVAIDDIQPGDEIYLDYGTAWQDAWMEHAQSWTDPPDALQFKSNNSAFFYTNQDRIYLEEDTARYPPAHVQVRCWVDRSTLDEVDDIGWYGWNPAKKTKENRYGLANTEPCRVIHASDNGTGNGRMAYYHVMLAKDHKPVKNVPWQYITFVDATYSGNQFLPQAFRKEIQLPDAMMFDAWKDIENPPTTATTTTAADPQGSATTSTQRALLESENCDLWLAESTVPDTGYGLFTGKNLVKDDVISPLDVAIQIADFDANMMLQAQPPPAWLMKNYFWNATVTQAVFESEDTWSILPGLGMLTQSHPALANLDPEGCQDREPSKRSEPHAGAFSHYQEVTFSVDRTLPAGHELFAKYDVSWYQSRHAIFGKDPPMAHDYAAADAILQGWKAAMSGNINTRTAQNVWNLLIETVGPHMKSTVHRALPGTPEEAMQTLSANEGTAKAAAPDAIRSIEWLERNGMCVDNIVVRKVEGEGDDDEILGRGAYAKRAIKAGSLVAPAPVIHMHRRHLEMFNVDENGFLGSTGHQLLLNYCFGHPSSSVLLFPTSPGVNLINHPTKNQTANIGIRWSERMRKPEMLKLSVEDLMSSSDAGLMMEYFALADIQPGDPLLLDYGSSWEKAWSDHLEKWYETVNAADYVSAWSYDRADRIYTELEDQYPPSWIQVRAWVDRGMLGKPDDSGWREWHPSDSFTGGLDETEACRVVSSSGDTSSTGAKATYNIILEKDKLPVKYVPWNYITFVEAPYTSNQFLRQAFRHEIQLPDEMIPDAWKDLEPKINESCGLYMAQSAIPNSGWGMFSAEAISKGDRIFSGELIVQAEDVKLNRKLRHWKDKDFDFEEPDWLLENYYWNSEVSFGYYEAPHIQSIIPGLGMLANSHMGLVNAETQFPVRIADLHRAKDPGAGASTNYHDFFYTAKKSIKPGEELYVSYGDKWFKNRDDLGMIPISKSFREADKVLKELWDEIGQDINSPTAQDAWDALMQLLEEEEDERLVNAFPRKLEDLPKAVKGGTAALTVPNRIRSLDWLEQNGVCLDNIEPRKSTIRQAGHGAFATRTIQKGQIIAPLPVVHLRRHHMEIYDADDYNDKESAVWKDGTQQLLNYCYGHPESSLLFFPYSPVINYVNHNFTGYNAEVRWSSLAQHGDDWMKRSPDDLDKEDHSGLVMEMVATRTIKPGEEVFLNYGSNWEKAWNDHVENFSPTPKELSYFSATEMNRRMMWVKTVEELKVDPYPGSKINTVCFAGVLPKVGEDEAKPTIVWTYQDGIYEDFDSAEICEILSRDDDVSFDEAFDRSDSIQPLDLHYTVRMIGSKKARGVIVKHVPRLAIQFYDKQYSSDMFWRRGFRHEIGIPDEMLPEAWRDMPTKA